jgi:hypothetical protein
MAKIRIRSPDLLWILRERLSVHGDCFKVAPMAIVPSEDGWQVVTSPRYRTAGPQFASALSKSRRSSSPFTVCSGIKAKQSFARGKDLRFNEGAFFEGYSNE